MKFSFAFLVIALAAVAPAAAVAGLPRAPAADFYNPPLGSSRSLLPRGLRSLPDCQETRSHTDCEYEGAGGLRYLVFGQIVTRKRLNLRTARGTVIPFGIRRGDDRSAILEKVRRRTGLRLRPAPGGRAWAATALNARGVEITLYASFDRNGRLVEIGVTAGETG